MTVRLAAPALPHRAGEKDRRICSSFRKGESVDEFWHVVKVADTQNRPR